MFHLIATNQATAAAIAAEYDELAKLPEVKLKGIFKRSCRIFDLRGLSKDDLITMVLQERHSLNRRDCNFGA